MVDQNQLVEDEIGDPDLILDGGDVEPPGGARDGVQAGPRQQQAGHLQGQPHALQLCELVTANQLKTRQH